MFSNINSTPNQTQNFGVFNQQANKSSPFGFNNQQAPQANTSLFQSPTPSAFASQQNTPLFQNNQTQRPLFGNTQTIGTPAPNTGMFNNPQNNIFSSNPSTSLGFGTSTSQTGGFSSNFQSQPQNPTTSVILLGPGPSSTFNTQSSQSIFSNPTSQTNQFGSLGTSTSFGSQSTQGGFGAWRPSSGTVAQTSGLGTGSQSSQSLFGGQTSQTGSLPAPQISAFGLQSNQSVFNTQTTQPSSFGSLSQPVRTGFQSSNVFGSTATSQTGFGLGASSQPSQSMFGSSSFGTQQPTSNIGSSIFGGSNQPASSTFGKTSFGGFQSSGAIGSGFGTQSSVFNTQPQSSLSQTSSLSTSKPFQTSGFGSTTTQPFGSSQSSQSIFGGQKFGQTTGFGTSQSSASLPFSGGSQGQVGSNIFQSQSSMFPSSLPQSSTTQTLLGLSTCQPSSSIFGGGLGQSQPSGQSMLCTTSFPSQSTSNFLAPSNQGSLYSGTQNLAPLINNEPDKSIETFGYRASATRFGQPEYYNTNFTNLPELANVTETGLTMASTVSNQEINNFSSLPYEHDLKLGSVRNANNDLELSNPPSDTITRLRFNRQQPELLACSSWDGTVSVYKVDEQLNNLLGSKISTNGCVFDLDWIYNTNNVMLASSSGILFNYDIMTNTMSEFTRHNGPIKTVKSCGDFHNNVVLSGSYDGTVKFWDTRTKMCASTINAYGKVYDIDVCRSGFSFITSDREIFIYNFTDTNRPLFRKKVDIRCISMTTFNCRKEGGYVSAVGTCGGKVAIFARSNNASYLMTVMNQNRMNSQIAYPVHDIEFHPTSYVLGLAGGDGAISFWDIQNHSSVLTLKSSTLPVTSMSFNSSGKLLAYAIGYDWSRGIRAYKYASMAPSIYIRRCGEELRHQCPKPIHP